MDTIVVKTEVQSNGEILLYYVDENGENQEGVLTSIENIENDAIQIQDNSYMLENYDELVDDPPVLEEHAEQSNPWSDEDTKRLLTFYNDNKKSFTSGSTQKRHLWAVACKTMLIGKNQQSCEEKLEELKIKYREARSYIDNRVYVKWPFLDLCHVAFHDDIYISDNETQIIEAQKIEEPSQLKVETVKHEKIKDEVGILSVKQINIKSPDEQTKQLLNLYLKYKEQFRKEHWSRDLWDKVAEELGENDSEYIQKKFLNHKQHYITMCIKRKEDGKASVNWPYMALFDKIYEDDAHFHKKHFNEDIHAVINHTVPEYEWNIAQKMILAKYYFDCYDEFQDETIPKQFLWTEVGRFIDKKPETCQTRYEMLRREHLEKHAAGDYNIQKRIPLAILFDNIILKDVKIVLSKMETYDFENDLLEEEQVDELVQYFYNNMEVFKDKDCHFVCWAAIAHKLKKSIESCRHQWDELINLYKQILNEKKEDSDLQIDWRYIDLFDRLFDYGMDEALLRGYDAEIKLPQFASQVAVKKVNIRDESLDDNNLLVERTPPKREIPVNTKHSNEPRTDPRSTKILEHYLKNKDKFQHVRNKITLWEQLAKQIGLNSTECAHRFRTLKQTYIDFIKKEIDKPRIPITWPYYALCKRVFGYRVLKNKLKQGELESDNGDWLAREIKLLISFFSRNFNEITNNIDDLSKWTPLAQDIGKTESNCKEKFVELRKCYRKLKTMRARNPDVKISWSYFNLFDRIYATKDAEPMKVEHLEEEHLEAEMGDEDYQCIIVLQDGQVMLQNSEVINDPDLIQQLQNSNLAQESKNINKYRQNSSKWTKRNKKRLLVCYINYIRTHRGKEINPKDIWTNISSKIKNKTPKDCRKMLVKMLNSYKNADESVKSSSPFSFLLEKVLKLNPKFLDNKNKRKEKVYKDVTMDFEKVNLALKYYLEHIEEFVNPKFERKYLWTQLANHISEPVTKVYNKINYLKQAYNIETEEIAGEKTEFSSILKEIIAKEVAAKLVLDINPSTNFCVKEDTWTDDETEQLLIWYLGNLEMFKNPKFNRSYLWMDASNILNKIPLACSKKMIEIRTQYRNMVKQNIETLNEWRFLELCQKIYGTGKKS